MFGKFCAVLLASVVAAGDQEKCNVLVLSGGGSNGAWEAGIIWGLLHYGDPKDFTWDVVSGISAGSINTGALVPWAVGDELAASEWLSE